MVISPVMCVSVYTALLYCGNELIFPASSAAAMTDVRLTVNEQGRRNVKEPPDTSQDTPLMTLFREYSKALDEKNDKYERIYKTSRDVTVRSKRIIFTLQRIPG